MKGVAHDLAYKRNAINKLSKSVATINSHNLAYKLSPFIDQSNLEDMERDVQEHERCKVKQSK